MNEFKPSPSMALYGVEATNDAPVKNPETAYSENNSAALSWFAAMRLTPPQSCDIPYPAEKTRVIDNGMAEIGIKSGTRGKRL